MTDSNPTDDAFETYAAAVEAAFESTTGVVRAHADADDATVLVCAGEGDDYREAIQATAARFGVRIVDEDDLDKMDGIDYTVALSDA